MNEYTVVPEEDLFGIAIGGRIVVHELEKDQAEVSAADFNRDLIKQEAA